MEAMVCETLGDPTLSHPKENAPIVVRTNHPIPVLDSPTAVRVRVTATSLNYANYLQILGKYQEKVDLPFIPGSDYSGIVDSIGSRVSGFKVGDRVCALGSLGSFAEFVVADEALLFKLPDGCDLKAAAAITVAFGTSHVALSHRAQLTTGQVLLVLGAAGGVGLAAVQIGKLLGATVIASVRGAEKAQFLKSFAVDHVIDLSVENLLESVKEFLSQKKLKGVDVLYDPVGGKLAKDALKLLNWSAHILIIGFASGEVPVIPANIALVKNWTIHGLYTGSYTYHRPAVLRHSIEELLSWFARGMITVHVFRTYTLSEAKDAFSAIKNREVIGKVLLLPGGYRSASSRL